MTFAKRPMKWAVVRFGFLSITVKRKTRSTNDVTFVRPDFLPKQHEMAFPLAKMGTLSYDFRVIGDSEVWMDFFRAWPLRGRGF